MKGAVGAESQGLAKVSAGSAADKVTGEALVNQSLAYVALSRGRYDALILRTTKRSSRRL
jgi:hypothetical protein